MKKKAFSFASRMSVIVLVCMFVAFIASCESDSPEIPIDGTPEEEGSIDDVLSIDITPMSFSTEEREAFYLFDYTPGGQFVGMERVVPKWYNGEEFVVDVDLRRGKHKLLWITGICNLESEGVDWWSGKKHGVHYDPEKKELVWYDDEVSSSRELTYCELNIEVTDHKQPIKTLTFLPATSYLRVVGTDLLSQPIDLPKGDSWEEVGTLNISKRIKTMSLTGKGYTLAEEGISGLFYACEGSYVIAGTPLMLCPFGGLNDVQVTCNIKNKQGQIIPTTLLPNISLRRGCDTSLEGPLFSGRTSDWKVTIYPYER